jgi:hypothetical protein
MHGTLTRSARQSRCYFTVLVAMPLAGCASVRPLTRARAVEAAQRNVCGAPYAGRDSTCTVRSAEPIRGGYRVLLDRRPPAGSDRLAIEVRRGGDQIDVFPLDSTKASAMPK